MEQTERGRRSHIPLNFADPLRLTRTSQPVGPMYEQANSNNMINELMAICSIEVAIWLEIALIMATAEICFNKSTYTPAMRFRKASIIPQVIHGED